MEDQPIIFLKIDVKRENYHNLADKLAAIYGDTNKKEDFIQADLAYKRLFLEGK